MHGRRPAWPRDQPTWWPGRTWTLAQWADDVREFCDVLGIARPIVFGASFGGTVALAYATRHPEHPARLILASTEAAGGTHLAQRVAMFERLGGPKLGALARRRFLEATPTPRRWRRGRASRFRCTRGHHAIRMS